MLFNNSNNNKPHLADHISTADQGITVHIPIELKDMGRWRQL